MSQYKEKIGQEDVEISVGKMMQHYLKHWKAVVLCGVCAALLAFTFTFLFVTPMYRATVTIYVNNSKGFQNATEVNGQNLATAQRLVNTYVNIIQSNTVLSDVIEKGRLNCTAQSIRANMTAHQISNTEMFTVTIAHSDAEMATEIANTIAEVAPESISEFIEGSSTKIVDYAVVPQRPYTPDYKKNVAVGGLMGCVIILVLLTLQYVFDMRLEDEEDIASYFSEPVLGTIPTFKDLSGREGAGA